MYEPAEKCPNCGDAPRRIPRSSEYCCGVCWLYLIDGRWFDANTCNESHQHTTACMLEVKR